MKKMIKMVLILSSLLVVSAPSQADWVCVAKNMQNHFVWIYHSTCEQRAMNLALTNCQNSEYTKHPSTCHIQSCVWQKHW